MYGQNGGQEKDKESYMDGKQKDDNCMVNEECDSEAVDELGIKLRKALRKQLMKTIARIATYYRFYTPHPRLSRSVGRAYHARLTETLSVRNTTYTRQRHRHSKALLISRSMNS